MKKTIFLSLASALAMLVLNSCAQCYNDRFAQSMIGLPADTLVATIGTPTQVQQVGNTTTYTWFTDDSYTSSYTRPERETVWRDDEGRKHREWYPAEVVNTFHDRKANLTFICQNGRVVNYQSSFTGDMCNSFIPQQYIQQFVAEDEAARAAR
ncbi:MAG: hypothetical protein R3Y56_01755 [Akkermansia sp.]